MKNKYKFLTNKNFKKAQTCFVSLAVLASLISGCYCHANVNQTTNGYISEVTQETEYTHSAFTNVSLPSDIIESTAVSSEIFPSETEFVYTPDLILSNEPKYSLDVYEYCELVDMGVIRSSCCYYFCYGVDNVQLLNNLRDYYGDQTLTIDDFNYLTPVNCTYDVNCSFENYFPDFNSYYVSDLFLNHLFCLLEDNNLRFIIDEFPSSYFEQNCSNIYDDIVGYSDETHDKFLRYISDFQSMNSYDDLIEKYGPVDSDEYKNAIEWLNFIVGQYNNQILHRLKECYVYYTDAYYAVGIPCGRTSDGRFVLAPNETQFNGMKEVVNSSEGFEWLPFGQYLTEDQLIEAGFDVDTYRSAQSAIKSNNYDR